MEYLVGIYLTSLFGITSVISIPIKMAFFHIFPFFSSITYHPVDIQTPRPGARFDRAYYLPP